mgnify:CR=1 FL=1
MSTPVMLQALEVFVRLVQRFVWAICVIALSASAVFASTEFDRQCQRLLPLADEFAKKCLKEAVPFSRMFYPAGGTRGEREAFRILFSDAYADSHFFMGCTIDANDELDFVGIYYKTSTEPLPQFTSEQIGFVDFQDNAGIRVNGRKQILIAVRQFDTDIIPERYGVRARNCEPGDMEGKSPSADGATFIRNPKKPEEWAYTFRAALDPQIAPYRVFFNSGEAPIIWKDLGANFIDASGTLIVLDEWYRSACTKWNDIYAVEGIIQETCNLKQY